MSPSDIVMDIEPWSLLTKSADVDGAEEFALPYTVNLYEPLAPMIQRSNAKAPLVPRTL